MIKLIPFTMEDFKLLSSWIKNEDDMVQFSGGTFSYPITKEQIQTCLNDNKSHIFKFIYQDVAIGLGEIYLEDKKTIKLGKILIGDNKFRGRGFGKIIINKLLKKSFEEFHVKCVHLYVYDWNIGAIKCYEKCGMVKNQKTKITKFNNTIWTAINMGIDKNSWGNDRLSNHKP